MFLFAELPVTEQVSNHPVYIGMAIGIIAVVSSFFAYRRIRKDIEDQLVANREQARKDVMFEIQPKIDAMKAEIAALREQVERDHNGKRQARQHLAKAINLAAKSSQFDIVDEVIAAQDALA